MKNAILLGSLMPQGYTTVEVRHINPWTGKFESGGIWVPLADRKLNILTTGTSGGRDHIHQQVYVNTAAGTRGAGFIAVSENTGAAGVNDVILSGEITTGGLARADATTKTHTIGTNLTTLQHTFTATSTFSGVQKTAIFNHATSGTMPHTNTFASTNLISGDELRVTWELTLG